MHTIGIDFGTTKTLVTRINPANNWPVSVRLGVGSDYIPTTVYVDEGGSIHFGDDADERMADDTGAYLRGFKMKLGSPTPLLIRFTENGETIRLMAKDLVREYLRYIRKQVESRVFMEQGTVNSAIITRPVNFSPALLEELKQAAREAGFTKVHFTTEPEAAGLAFCRMNAAKAFKRSALVVDWGGGTLDFALVTRKGDTIYTHPRLTDGDTTMGGEHFDNLLLNYIQQNLQKKKITELNHITARQVVRRNKERLSTDTRTTVRLSSKGGACPPITLTRELFNEMIAANIEQAAKKVRNLIAKIPEENKPEMLLLVGGSCKIPYIKEKLEAACGLPAYAWEHSREAVGLGAALWSNAPTDDIPGMQDTFRVPTPAPEPTDDAEQYFRQGMAHYHGTGVSPHYPRAAYDFLRAAQAGHAEAQYLLGTMYNKGQGMPQNATQAAHYYRQAAEQGHIKAQFDLANMYQQGVGVPQDHAQALHWYRKAAELGDAEATYQVGRMYDAGCGVAQNPTIAAYCYLKAAEQGIVRAQFDLAEAYYHGRGVVQNYTEARRRYKQAGKQGHTKSQYLVGYILENGLGIAPKYEQAAHWYHLAAEQGHADAQFRLANLYIAGKGVTQNYATAVNLYRQAAHNNHEQAKDALARFSLFLGKTFG
ncbi:MAG: hypothetical protein E7033_01575 [Akkermansiaceae bacterium]|nr:hypothetical protein [Akkermansiaceae bacterium]